MAQGYEVVAHEEPEALARAVPEQDNLVAVICDCHEPTNHLTRLRQLLEARGILAADQPSLILLGQGSGNLDVATGRARALAADGLWLEPYKTDPLSSLFPPADG